MGNGALHAIVSRPPARQGHDSATATPMAVDGSFCCRSALEAFLVSDSVAVMRFAMGAGHDGASGQNPPKVPG
jgi:hypothetical protein